MLKLINKATGEEVKVGDVVTDFRGEQAKVTGWVRPYHAGSTGRIYVQRGLHDQGYYPSVYDCEWQDEKGYQL
jgi:hypothetical protein